MMKDRMPAPDWYRCPLGALAEIRGRDLARGVEAAHDHVGGAGEAGQAGPVAPVEPGRALVPDVGEPALGQDLEVVGDRGLPHADPVNDRPHAQRGVAGEEQAQDLRPDRVCERPEPARAGLGRPRSMITAAATSSTIRDGCCGGQGGSPAGHDACSFSVCTSHIARRHATGRRNPSRGSPPAADVTEPARPSQWPDQTEGVCCGL
jgi:hypothetical protein